MDKILEGEKPLIRICKLKLSNNLTTEKMQLSQMCLESLRSLLLIA